MTITGKAMMRFEHATPDIATLIVLEAASPAFTAEPRFRPRPVRNAFKERPLRESHPTTPRAEHFVR
jgi:hypothetical protein